MSNSTLFDNTYECQKRPLLQKLIEHLHPIYSAEELKALRIDSISRDILSQRSGRGFVNRDLLETVLGNLLECVAPGSHNALGTLPSLGLASGIEEISNQLYAMIAQSLLAADGKEKNLETRALESTFGLLSELPALKKRALWNRFASLKDPAVWDTYITSQYGIEASQLGDIDFIQHINTAIKHRNFDYYREFLKEQNLAGAFDYQLQLVISTYPGWRVLFYHDISHALTQSEPVDSIPGIHRKPVPLLPRAISELGGRYYQADLHPETQIGDANFIEHPHRGLTTGQTGIIGSGCTLYPCTLGGISEKIKHRHPTIGDYVLIGTDATLLGPVRIGNNSTIGSGTDITGYIETGARCSIASSVIIGTVRTSSKTPGKILMGKEVRVGDGTVIENSTELDLVIPDQSEIPARSHVVNDGFGNPRYVRE